MTERGAEVHLLIKSYVFLAKDIFIIHVYILCKNPTFPQGGSHLTLGISALDFIIRSQRRKPSRIVDARADPESTLVGRDTMGLGLRQSFPKDCLWLDVVLLCKIQRVQFQQFITHIS